MAARIGYSEIVSERIADRAGFSVRHSFGGVLGVVVITALEAGCGAGTRHQAAVMQDAPGPVATSIADGGAQPMPTSTDAGAAVTIAPAASDDVVDAGASPPAHPPVKIAGRCVDMLVDAKARGKLPKEADLFQDPTQVDLDGDGADDFIYTVGADANDYSGYIYITRGACGIMVFAWVGSTPTPTKSSTHGFSDLEIRSTCKPTCCPSTSISTWHWNGSVYAKSGARTEKRDCSHPVGSVFNVQQTP
jgi:hypothetical protein